MEDTLHLGCSAYAWGFESLCGHYYLDIVQFGRTLGLGPWGCRFKSCYSDLNKIICSNGGTGIHDGLKIRCPRGLRVRLPLVASCCSDGMADIADLKSAAFGREGSSPFYNTIKNKKKKGLKHYEKHILLFNFILFFFSIYNIICSYLYGFL